jgi:capsular polysaccharide biosynthesis protein
MKDEKVIIRDILSTLWRYKVAIAMIFVMTLGFTFTLTKVMKKKYKSEFEINVYSKYFKNALISDIIPGVYQIPEMRFTIDSMVKEAISDDYIDQLAIDYNFYDVESDELSLAKNRQFLKDRFSLYSTGGQSYKVSFTDSDPYVAKKVSDETLERVKMQFINSRIQTIEMVKQMMFQRLQALNASQKITNKGEEKALASKSPDVLMAQLSKIDANLSALSKQYNTSHPKIQELLTRRATIKIWLEEFDNSPEASADMASLTMPADKLISGQITSKFYTKYHDFTMALDIEKKSLESYIGIIQRPQLPIYPIWPKKRLFAAVGFLLAMIFSFLYVFIKEVMMPSRKELLAQEAKQLGCDFLGTIKVGKTELSSQNILAEDDTSKMI